MLLADQPQLLANLGSRRSRKFHEVLRLAGDKESRIADADTTFHSNADADTQARLGYGGALSAQMYYLHNFTFGLAGALVEELEPA